MTTSLRERRETAFACARVALEMLAERGIEACLVGELARGDFRLHSPVDVLVESPIADHLELASEIDWCFRGSTLSVEIMFSECVDDAEYARMTRHMLYLEDLS